MKSISKVMLVACLTGVVGVAHAQDAEEVAGAAEPIAATSGIEPDTIMEAAEPTPLPPLMVVTTLQDAVAVALSRNPTLESQRASRAIAGETLEQARAGRRPSVSLSSSAGVSRSQSNAPTLFAAQRNSRTDLGTGTLGLQLVQPLYAGGALTANVKRAKAETRFSDAQLDAASQGLILDVITAYLNVTTDKAALDIRRNNVNVLSTQVRAANDRFRVGEVTRTDVAQAEARLSGAQAFMARARAQYEGSRAAFREIVGLPPGELELVPDVITEVDSIEAAFEIGRTENPAIRQDIAALEAARHLVKAAKARRKPSVSFVAAAGASQNAAESSLTGDNTYSSGNVEASVQMSMPLYQGGLLSSQIRQAQLEEARYRLRLQADQQTLVADISSIWYSLLAAKETIDASQRQVEAAEVAYRGSEQELAVGLRTTLEVLDQEQELLEARLALVEAQRSAYLAEHQLMATMGRLSPDRFGVNIPLFTPNDYSVSD